MVAHLGFLATELTHDGRCQHTTALAGAHRRGAEGTNFVLEARSAPRSRPRSDAAGLREHPRKLRKAPAMAPESRARHRRMVLGQTGMDAAVALGGSAAAERKKQETRP